MAEGKAPYNYFELDFPAVLKRKVSLMAQRPELQVYIPSIFLTNLHIQVFIYSLIFLLGIVNISRLSS